MDSKIGGPVKMYVPTCLLCSLYLFVEVGCAHKHTRAHTHIAQIGILVACPPGRSPTHSRHTYTNLTSEEKKSRIEVCSVGRDVCTLWAGSHSSRLFHRTYTYTDLPYTRST